MVVIRDVARSLIVASCFVLALVAVVPSCVSAQESGAPVGIRRVLLFLDVSPDARFSRDELGFLRDSLLAELASYRETVAIVEWASTESGAERTTDGYARSDIDGRDRTEYAFANGCDIWLTVTVTGSTETPGYQAYALDLVTRKTAVELTIESQAALRARDLARRFWRDLVEGLVANLETPESGTLVTFVGVPGSTIAGVTEDDIVLDQDGSATIRLPNPNVFTWRALHIGYDVASGVLEVGDDALTVDLNQQAAPRNQVDVGLLTLNYPLLSYSRYIVPDYLFARLSLSSYLAGYSLASSSSQGVSFVSFPLSELSVQVVGYYTAPDQNVRGYAGISGGVRVVHSLQLLGFEPIAPFTVGFVAGADVRVRQHFAVWMELDPTMLFARDVAFLAGAIDRNSDNFPIVRTGVGLLEPMRFSVGGRYRW